MAYVNRLNAEELDEVVDLHFPAIVAECGAAVAGRSFFTWLIMARITGRRSWRCLRVSARATFEQDLMLHLWSTEG